MDNRYYTSDIRRLLDLWLTMGQMEPPLFCYHDHLDVVFVGKSDAELMQPFELLWPSSLQCGTFSVVKF